MWLISLGTLLFSERKWRRIGRGEEGGGGGGCWKEGGEAAVKMQYMRK